LASKIPAAPANEVEVTPAVIARITGTLFTTESIFGAAFIAAVTLLSINAADISGRDEFAGLPSTISLLGRALIAVPIGWIVDRYGRRPGVILGYLLGAIGLAVSAGAVGMRSFPLLLLGSALGGAANGTSLQNRFTASEMYPADERARIIGLIVFAGTIGAVGGPLLVAPMVALATSAGLEGNAGPYLFGSVLTAIAALITFFFLRPDPGKISQQMERAEHGGVTPTGRTLSGVFADPAVQLAVASMVVGQLVMNLIMVITPVHMHHINHTTTEIAVVFTAHTLGMFGFSAMTGWLAARFGSGRVVAAGAAMLIVSSLLAPMATGVPMLAFVLFLLGLGWNFCFVGGSAMLSAALRPGERGRAQGANEVLVALASGLGSLSTGVIFAGGGMLGIGIVSLVMTLLFVAASLWLARGRMVPSL